jgi:putative mRNA 3-end processing factor
LQYRLQDAKVQGISYGEPINIHGVKFTFYPAGHIVGSAQIKAEYKGESWVVTGDYKIQKDPVAEAFEPVKCQHLITECTFGLPVFKWKGTDLLAEEINNWWKECQEEEVIPVIGAYSLGKAQRVLCMLDQRIGKVFTHGAVENTNQVMREQGIDLPPTTYVNKELKKNDYKGGIVIAPPSAMRSNWMRKFQPYRTAMASGWMALRGNRRRRNVDRGFVISDHADWAGLDFAIRESGAEKVYVTHGYTDIFSQWLNKEKDIDAEVLKTSFDSSNDA